MQKAEKRQGKGQMKSKEEAPEEIDIGERLRGVKHKLVVMSGKGGVGKSTVAANLAMALTMHGKSVGIVDCDIHGPTIPKMLGIEDRIPAMSAKGLEPVMVPPRLKVMSMGFLISNRDSPVIWRGPLKMAVIKQFLGEVNWGDLDYLIIDLPPGTGDEPLSVAQLLPAPDGAIIVTTPQDVALLSVRKSINFARALNMRVLGLIENMSGFTCPHCGKTMNIFGSGGGQKACMDLTVPLLGCIPLDPMIAETGDSGKPFVLESSDSPAVKAFDEIALKLEEIVENNGRKETK
jgi:Mrp family chromosome partitioning ATPase